MWRICVAVPDPHSFIAIVSIKIRDWQYTHTRHISRWRHVCRKQLTKQIAWCNLYTDNYQLWAADTEISQRKILFEIDVVGQPRFPINVSRPRPHKEALGSHENDSQMLIFENCFPSDYCCKLLPVVFVLTLVSARCNSFTVLFRRHYGHCACSLVFRIWIVFVWTENDVKTIVWIDTNLFSLLLFSRLWIIFVCREHSYQWEGYIKLLLKSFFLFICRGTSKISVLFACENIDFQEKCKYIGISV